VEIDKLYSLALMFTQGQMNDNIKVEIEESGGKGTTLTYSTGNRKLL
jgi:hypothetical protein